MDAYEQWFGLYEVVSEKITFHDEDDMDAREVSLPNGCEFELKSGVSIARANSYIGWVGGSFNFFMTRDCFESFWDNECLRKMPITQSVVDCHCKRCGRHGDHTGMQYYPMNNECRWI